MHSTLFHQLFFMIDPPLPLFLFSAMAVQAIFVVWLVFVSFDFVQQSLPIVLGLAELPTYVPLL